LLEQDISLHKFSLEQRSARAPFSRPRSSSRLLAYPSPRSRQDRGEDFFLIPRSFRGKNEEFLGCLTFFETNTKDETRIKLSPRSRRDRGEEFLLIPRSFRGRCEDLADLWFRDYCTVTHLNCAMLAFLPNTYVLFSLMYGRCHQTLTCKSILLIKNPPGQIVSSSCQVVMRWYSYLRRQRRSFWLSLAAAGVVAVV